MLIDMPGLSIQLHNLLSGKLPFSRYIFDQHVLYFYIRIALKNGRIFSSDCKKFFRFCLLHESHIFAIRFPSLGNGFCVKINTTIGTHSVFRHIYRKIKIRFRIGFIFQSEMPPLLRQRAETIAYHSFTKNHTVFDLFL